ncbi:hypothetical protein EIP91_006431 [Steccherinum ochraceum]|uniref:Uncharacterized protein n=1 Tax=Steccherinum ochraceum TaxID=92696 RepID=A0A4R0RE21_9APHY|nr:hypothetical protein EIP91_006431 [Steccherinum ochraceum]
MSRRRGSDAAYDEQYPLVLAEGAAPPVYLNSPGNLPQYGFGWALLRPDLIKHFQLKKSTDLEAVLTDAANALAEKSTASGVDKQLPYTSDIGKQILDHASTPFFDHGLLFVLRNTSAKAIQDSQNQDVIEKLKAMTDGLGRPRWYRIAPRSMVAQNKVAVCTVP